MYKITSLMRMEKNGAYLSNFGNEKSCKTKGKNKKKKQLCIQTLLMLMRMFPTGIQVKKTKTNLYVYWK